MKKILLMIILIIPFFVNANILRRVLFIPVGGYITDITDCTCSGGIALTILTPFLTLENHVFQLPISTLYSRYSLRNGVNVLGLSYKGGVCSTGKACTTLPVAGTIYNIGTSI